MNITELHRGDSVLVALDRWTQERARVLGPTGEGLVRVLPAVGRPRTVIPQQITKIFKS